MGFCLLSAPLARIHHETLVPRVGFLLDATKHSLCQPREPPKERNNKTTTKRANSSEVSILAIIAKEDLHAAAKIKSPLPSFSLPFEGPSNVFYRNKTASTTTVAPHLCGQQGSQPNGIRTNRHTAASTYPFSPFLRRSYVRMYE